MNKLIALFAMIVGFAVVANDVDAAGRKKNHREKVVEHPAVLSPEKEAEYRAFVKKVEAERAERMIAKEEKAKAGKLAATITWTKEKGNQAVDLVKENPKTAVVAGVGAVVATAVVVDLCRGKNSRIRKFFRSERYNQIAAMKAAKEAQARA